jgi:broad specificity phosphatase PhoE
MHPKVLLIRHGQTAVNRQGLVYERADEIEKISSQLRKGFDRKMS